MGFIPMPGMKPCRFSKLGHKKVPGPMSGNFPTNFKRRGRTRTCDSGTSDRNSYIPGRRSRKARHFKYIHKKAPKIFEAFLAVRTGLEPATPCVTGMYSNQLNYRTILEVFSCLLLGSLPNCGAKISIYFFSAIALRYFLFIFVTYCTIAPDKRCRRR